MKVEMWAHPTEEDWMKAKVRALVTAGKKAVNSPDYDWKVKMLRCRHSPIRKLPFAFYIEGMPYWLHVELVRHHVGIEKYVKTQRDDRTDNDIPRGDKPQKAPVNVIIDLNGESILTLMNKRLCGAATKEMQEFMFTIRKLVIDTNPEFEEFLVPMCKYVHECKEFKTCGGKAVWFERMAYGD